jgi:ferredoxin
MKAHVDPDTCIGCGLCPEICPEVFEMEESIARAKVEEVPDDVKDKCQEAADSCPVTAIHIS